MCSKLKRNPIRNKKNNYPAICVFFHNSILQITYTALLEKLQLLSQPAKKLQVLAKPTFQHGVHET
jgi:hypothetical protein